MNETTTGASRRRMMGAGLGLAAVSSVLPLASAAAATKAAAPAKKTGMSSATFTLPDGTSLYYKDWGTGQPVVFHHGWPLTSDEWDTQMLYFLGNGYRVIAPDRRGLIAAHARQIGW